MLRRWLRKVASPAHHAVSELPGVVRHADVRFLGRSSKGGRQIIGNGTLALTHDSLVFYMWRPASELVIPLADVVAVDTVTSHADERFSTRLLRVRWRDGVAEDAIAWQVSDLEGWLRALPPSA